MAAGFLYIGSWPSSLGGNLIVMAVNLEREPRSPADRRLRSNERLRAEFIACAEEEWRKRTAVGRHKHATVRVSPVGRRSHAVIGPRDWHEEIE